jgi:hypothetical protein
MKCSPESSFGAVTSYERVSALSGPRPSGSSRAPSGYGLCPSSMGSRGGDLQAVPPRRPCSPCSGPKAQGRGRRRVEAHSGNMDGRKGGGRAAQPTRPCSPCILGGFKVCSLLMGSLKNQWMLLEVANNVSPRLQPERDVCLRYHQILGLLSLRARMEDTLRALEASLTAVSPPLASSERWLAQVGIVKDSSALSCREMGGQLQVGRAAPGRE